MSSTPAFEFLSGLPEKCRNADLISQNIIYKILIVLKCMATSSAIGILVFLAYSYQKIQVKIYHPNTKVIALILYIFVFLNALDTTTTYVIEIWRVSYPYINPCDRLWSTKLLFCLRTMYVSFVNGINSSLVVLCIERLVCIVRISNYEQSSKPFLVAALLLLTTIISTVVFTLLYTPGIEWNEGLAVTTIRNSKNGVYYQMVLIYLAVLEGLGVFSLLFIRYWSLWYRKTIRGFKFIAQRTEWNVVAKNETLSVKFQIEETLEITGLFLPVIIVKCTLGLFSYTVASIANHIWPNPPADIQLIILELVNPTLIAPFFTSLILAHGTGQLSRLFRCRAEARSRISTIVNSNINQDDYFDRLKHLFEKSAPNPAKKYERSPFQRLNPSANRVSDLSM